VPPNALADAERQRVLGVLTSDRFVDKSVAQAWATLLDEGTYLCSVSTIYRILRANGAAGERRAQATHPPRTKPELVATRPGQVWSCDITKLRGRDRGRYYDLYVVLDIFSASSWPRRSLPVRTARSPRRCLSRRWACTGSPRRSTPTGAPR
jgi:putative transposase